MTSSSFGHEIKLLLKVLVVANATVMSLTNKKWTLTGKQEKSSSFTPLTIVSGISWTGWKYKSWLIEQSCLSITRCKLNVLVIHGVFGGVKINGCTFVVYVSEKLKCSEHLSLGIIRLTNGCVFGQTYWRYTDPCKKIATEKFQNFQIWKNRKYGHPGSFKAATFSKQQKCISHLYIISHVPAAICCLFGHQL